MRVRLSYLVCFFVLCASFSASAKGDKDVLLKRLRSADAVTRRTAAEALAQVGDIDLGTDLPALLVALEDPEPEVRFYAVVTLQVAAYSSEAQAMKLGRAVPTLLKLLKDQEKDSRVKEAAVNAIALVLPSPPPAAAEAVLRILNDDEPKVRVAALGVLGGMPADSKLISAVSRVLNDDPSPEVRAHAAQTLGELGASQNLAIQALKKALRDDDTFVKQEAVRAAARIGPPASPVLDELKLIVQDPGEDQSIRNLARTAIARICQHSRRR